MEVVEGKMSGKIMYELLISLSFLQIGEQYFKFISLLSKMNGKKECQVSLLDWTFWYLVNDWPGFCKLWFFLSLVSANWRHWWLWWGGTGARGAELRGNASELFRNQVTEATQPPTHLPQSNFTNYLSLRARKSALKGASQ